MLPRICRERPVVNASMEEEMRQLCARLDVMVLAQDNFVKNRRIFEGIKEALENGGARHK